MIRKTWPEQPFIYEINAWVWLRDLEIRHGRRVALGSVPPREWDAIADMGMDAVWLMGVWERSPKSAAIARAHSGLREEFLRALPGLTPEDILGSPYSIRRYAADVRIGGPEGLAAARAALAKRGVRLVLDFTPNHVALDHPWVEERPELLVTPTDGARKTLPPDWFFESRGRRIAHGRDPYFPPWTDTAQVNIFNPETRRALTEELLCVAAQCDGVRCDMAMLLANRIFEGAWGSCGVGSPPPSEFWPEAIGVARKGAPGFLFIAEVYWGMEDDLLRMGFDYCYDKTLYERLVGGNAESIRRHAEADASWQKRTVRFLENHDEPRAASVMPLPRERAAAAAFASLPGAKLFHEGQFEGCRVKVPVQLGRRPDEPVNPGLRDFYGALLHAASAPLFRLGEWSPCQTIGWPDNDSHRNLLAWGLKLGAERALIAVNFSDVPSQGRVRPAWEDCAGKTWRLEDGISREVFVRSGDEIQSPGLFVDLPPWGFHFLLCQGCM